MQYNYVPKIMYASSRNVYQGHSLSENKPLFNVSKL